MLKAYKYRLYPDSQQQILLEKHFGCVRSIYNTGILFRKYSWQSRVRVGYKKTADELRLLKKEYPYFNEVNSQSLQSALINLDIAFVRMFKRQGGYPNFKSKRDKQSFSCPQSVTVDVRKSELYLPKFKSGIPIVLHRKFKGEIKNATISKTPTGKYFVSLLCETGEKIPDKKEITQNRSIGIDMGLTHFATIGDDDLSKVFKIENPKYLKRSLKLLKRRSRQHSKKEKGSKNREKARIRLARKHEKVTNQRKDFLHKVSYRLTRDNQTDIICVESLNVAGMKKNHKLANAISDAGWGEFFRQLRYKSDWTGKTVLEAEPFAPTSKDCHSCGYKNSSLTLKDREWDCPLCGAHHDRDENAVPNIISSAFERYNKSLALNRDGLPELTLGESSPLFSRKMLRKKVKTANQEKNLKPVSSLTA